MDKSTSITSKFLTEKLCQLKTLTQNLSCKASLLVLPAVFFAPSAHLPKDSGTENSAQGLPCCKVAEQQEQNKKESALTKIEHNPHNQVFLVAPHLSSNSGSTDFSNKLTNTQPLSYLIHLPPTQEIRFYQGAHLESSIEIKQTQYLVPTINSVESVDLLTEPPTLGASLEFSEETIFAYLLGAFFLASFFCIYLGTRILSSSTFTVSTALQYQRNQTLYESSLKGLIDISRQAIFEIVKKSKNMRYLHSLSHTCAQPQLGCFHTA